MFKQFKFELIFLILINSFNLIISWDFNNNECDTYNDYPAWFISPNCRYNPDVMSDPNSLAKRHGYTLETHTITTETGYILNMFRIPPRQDDNRKSKQPIFIHHGIITNSAIWLDLGNKSLAFVLANNGYDVWLGNVRGSSYANQHKTLNVNDQKYWNFNLDNIVKYDIPKQLKYIASITKQGGNIIYIGHSMGTTLGFMYSSEFNKEANELLKGIIAMAPPIYFNNIPFVSQIAPYTPLIKKTLNSMGITGLFYQEKKIRSTTNQLCRFNPYLCKQVISSLFGKLTDQFLPNYLLLFYSYWPSGASVDMIVQFGQIAASGNFAKFDHGVSRNLEMYGQADPPKYDLSKIKMPVYIFYGKNDLLTSEENLIKAFKEIGSEDKVMQTIPPNSSAEESFNHLNFMYAKDIDTLFYESLFVALNKL